MEKLEPLVKIPDYSLYFDIILLSLIMIVAYILFVFYQKAKNKPLSKEELALQALENLETSDTKTSAYLITKYGRVLAKDTKSKEIFERLEEKLSSYKYKKTIKPFDDDTIALIELFLQVASHE